MVSLRKASAYSKKRARAFTRKSRIKQKSYIKTVPANKIVKYNMGSQRAFDLGKHKFVLTLRADEDIQVRDNALEACRTLLNKLLDREIPGEYYFAIKVYPHHILRENKTAAGAGADRLSSGMKHSYGIVVGRAARVKKGREILMVSVTNERAARIAKKAMATVKSKVPCKSRIVYTEIK